MHILKIIHGYPPNYNAGSEVYSQSICNELSKHHQVSIFTREENPYLVDFTIRKEQLIDSLEIYHVNNPNGKDGYRHKQLDDNFAQLIEEIKPDIAHIGHLNHLSIGIIDELNKKHIPIVFTLHDFWLMCPRGQFLTRSIGQTENFKVCDGQDHNKCASQCYQVYFSGFEDKQAEEVERWSKWVEYRMAYTSEVINKVDLFIAPSKYLMKRFIDDFDVPESKITYLDYGFPLSYLKSSKTIPDRATYTFGYIGTHIPAKGLNILIEAFKSIDLPAKLIIYGRANGQSTDSLKKLTEGSTNPIEFAGEYINHNLVDQVFSKIDCIVVPSIWAENSPLVIHEAQACQVPVITADFGGMKEYVKHQVNGLLFEHRNIDALAVQLNWALSNKHAMAKLGQRGYLQSTDGAVPDIEEHCIELVKIYKRQPKKSNFWRITIDTNPEDCNLKCIMCEEHSPFSDFIPKLYKETGIKRRRMEFATVESIFKEAATLGVREIIPSTMGEPLLYKQFDQIFELAQKLDIKINLTTNGTFPKKSVKEWAKLIVPNTSDVKISWNGATKETSENIMLKVDFDQAVLNVKEFIKYRDEHFQKTGYFCRVTFQLTFMQNNMHELADIVKLAASLGVDRVKGHQLWAHFDEIKDLSMKASKESAEMWNQYVKEAYRAQESYLKPNGEKVLLENIIPLNENEDITLPEDYECPFLGKELWVSATGKVSPCCAPDNLRQSLGDFGNINNTTITEVLNSEGYQDLVQNYKSKDLCKSCNMRKPSIN